MKIGKRICGMKPGSRGGWNEKERRKKMGKLCSDCTQSLVTEKRSMMQSCWMMEEKFWRKGQYCLSQKWEEFGKWRGV
jgi:hypothetical protein